MKNFKSLNIDKTLIKKILTIFNLLNIDNKPFFISYTSFQIAIYKNLIYLTISYRDKYIYFDIEYGNRNPKCMYYNFHFTFRYNLKNHTVKKNIYYKHKDILNNKLRNKAILIWNDKIYYYIQNNINIKLSEFLMNEISYKN